MAESNARQLVKAVMNSKAPMTCFKKHHLRIMRTFTDSVEAKNGIGHTD